MRDFDPKSLALTDLANLLQSGVAPRPIALVSTLSAEGRPNLSPFSFFNLFGMNPPVVGFSPSRRARDGTFKDTYRNLMATRECVVQAVTHSMVHQVSLASTEYPPEVDEFVKSGLTPVASEVVRPFRVLQSPFQMECVLQQMVALGEGNGSGNLALCEVVRVHVADDLLTGYHIDPQKLDLVGRMGANDYARASGDSVFRVAKPLQKRGIGFDSLPEWVFHSHILTANNLGQLANVERLPLLGEVTAFLADIPPGAADEGAFWRFERASDFERMLACALALGPKYPRAGLLMECVAKAALAAGEVDFAWKTLIAAHT